MGTFNSLDDKRRKICQNSQISTRVIRLPFSPPNSHPFIFLMSLSLEHYGLSPVTGFLPSKPPLQRLPDAYFAPWENRLDGLHEALADHSIRKDIQKVSECSPSPVTEPCLSCPCWIPLDSRPQKSIRGPFWSFAFYPMPMSGERKKPRR